MEEQSPYYDDIERKDLKVEFEKMLELYETIHSEKQKFVIQQLQGKTRPFGFTTCALEQHQTHAVRALRLHSFKEIAELPHLKLYEKILAVNATFYDLRKIVKKMNKETDENE